MSDHRNAAINYAREHYQNYLDKLKDLVAIPSVSTDPERTNEIKKAAEWLKKELEAQELTSVEIVETARHPIVYGEKLFAGDNAPTALIYGHYDVQPEDPVDEWNSDPFTPTVDGENLYGRGSTDMKGQIIACLSAIDAIQKTGDLPFNLKFLIEGEEEIGGSSLENFIRENTDMLTCDFFLNPDTGMIAPNVPSINYALRGISYFELRIQGPVQDLHSGTFGGVVHNPAQAMAEVLAGLHDQTGKVTLPGFYDKVIPLEQDEREELSRLPENEEFYLKQTGVNKLWGEEGYSANERVGARPTLEINGIYSGYIGEGQKTVLPAYAMAKISTRLVADQDPKQVYHQFIAYLEENVPDTVTWTLEEMAAEHPSLSDRKSRWIEAYISAAESTWGVKPLYKRIGGSVPVVAHIQQNLGVDSVNIGFGLPSDNLHGPNEKFHLPTFEKGIEALIHFFFNL
jgi:acetylornithine deacetylase/succinyl-diaminopimelate desuccinylase-like protein